LSLYDKAKKRYLYVDNRERISYIGVNEIFVFEMLLPNFRGCDGSSLVGMFMTNQILMTVDEVAAYLRVKKRTVYNWVKKGKIPAVKTVGQWRFKKERIDSWLDGEKEPRV
jgi:excisionase family DNA binding protein